MRTYVEFISGIQRRVAHPNGYTLLRYGQAIMNRLHEIWPEKYNEVTGTELDCFYDDKKAADLLDHLAEVWPSY